MCSSFEDLAGINKSYFEYLFKVENQVTTTEVIQISHFFLGQITEEDNIELLEEISEDELRETLHSFEGNST